MLRRRTARWLRVRILGLLSEDTRISRAMNALKPKEVADE